MATPNLQPPSILLMGPSGSGKTFSLSTLLEAGLEVFVISTEPRGIETLLDVVASKKLDLSKLHWRYIGPARAGFQILADQGDLIARSNQEALAKQIPKIRENPSWVEMLKTFVNFKDDKDGKEYGDVTKFDGTKAIVVDSLSGVSAMAMDVTVGDKVTAHVGEWGIAIKAIDKFILTCCSDLKCFFVMTAHIEREEDPNTGALKMMTSTLGKKLAPTIPRYFSEVLSAETDSDGDKKFFRWSNNNPQFVLKNRSLPISSKLPPNFGPIVEAYKKRLASIS